MQKSYFTKSDQHHLMGVATMGQAQLFFHYFGEFGQHTLQTQSEQLLYRQEILS